MTQTRKRTPEKDWRPAFLKELARTGNVLKSCVKAKIARSRAYSAKGEQPDFAAAWDEAVEISVEVLEAEAHRRAVDGTLRPVFQGKSLVGKVREYSDTLLIFLLKARRPGVYRDNSRVIVAGDPSAPLKHEHTLTSRIDELTDAFAGVADRASEGGAPGNSSGEPLDSAGSP